MSVYNSSHITHLPLHSAGSNSFRLSLVHSFTSNELILSYKLQSYTVCSGLEIRVTTQAYVYEEINSEICEFSKQRVTYITKLRKNVFLINFANRKIFTV